MKTRPHAMLTVPLLLLVLAPSAQAFEPFQKRPKNRALTILDTYDRYAPIRNDITWGPCPDSEDARLECGTFDVPMDYADPSAGKAELAVARYRSLAAANKGIIFSNPGGPGGSGVELIVGAGADLSRQAGEAYDIVSWDPRGVGQSMPDITCFANAQEETDFFAGSIVETNIEARSDPLAAVPGEGGFLDPHIAKAAETDALLAGFWEKCEERSNGTLKYVGSVAAVRDMVRLADILEGGVATPINYWGFSYGTLIGSYFVNMFPERVGRVILDGNVDPVGWSTTPQFLGWSEDLISTDEAFDGFAMACAAAGPSACALAQRGGSAAQVKQDVLDLIDTAYEYHKNGGQSISSSAVRNFIFDAMYQPSIWSDLAAAIASARAEFRNASLARIAEFSKGIITSLTALPLSETPESDWSIIAITCADAIDTTTETFTDVLNEILQATTDTSPMFAPIFANAGNYCHAWKSRAVERFTGPFNHQLANTILVFGNEADPITPLANAKIVADLLGDSAVLVEQDDYGHCTSALKSECTESIIAAYFDEGVIPSPGRVCGTDQILFPGQGITKNVLANAGANDVPHSSENIEIDPSLAAPSKLEAELAQLRSRDRTLSVAVYSLAAAVAVLVFALVIVLVWSWRRNRGRKVYTAPPVAIMNKEAFMESRTSLDTVVERYSDPYEDTERLRR